MIEPPKPAVSANAVEFRRVFLAQVHRLLRLGHARMDLKNYVNTEEPDITGELRDAMETVVDDPNAEEWLHYLHVEDEHHVKTPKRKGKRRKKVDIRLTASHPRPRNHFSFEAKRLDTKNPIRNYLGKKGLGCFLSGHYASGDDEAGMLGYVQSRSPDEWAVDLKTSLEKEGNKYSVCEGFAWSERPFPGGPPTTYHSRHLRQLEGPIDIFHNLLVFFA